MFSSPYLETKFLRTKFLRKKAIADFPQIYKMKKTFIFLIFFCFLSSVFLFFIFWGIYHPKDIFSDEEIIFNIERGQGSREIALALEKEGLIRWGPLFRAYVLVGGISGGLQAGTYSLSFSMNIPQMAEKFARGDILTDEITIIEGWNLRDIGFHLENRGMFQAEELWEIAGFPAADHSKTKDFPAPPDFSVDYQFLADKPEEAGLEGYLFPDTYKLNRGADLKEIIEIILDNFDNKLNKDLRKEIKKQQKTIFEVVNVASLIEKEVRTQDDKKLVSGILWKRLKNNVPLQVDATVSYITGKKTTKISKEETQIDSPYNTYKYRGLPLGPICNPGLESIKAAVYPESSQYWYYLSTPEGETIFSKNLEEHNIAKAKYLKNNE